MNRDAESAVCNVCRCPGQCLATIALAQRRRVKAVAIVVLLLVGAGALVYLAYLHVAYIPILVVAFFFGLTGSVLTTIAAALVIVLGCR